VVGGAGALRDADADVDALRERERGRGRTTQRGGYGLDDVEYAISKF